MRDCNSGLTLAAPVSFCLLLAACSSQTSTNAVGEAYVAPASLNLHSSLSTKSSTVAVLKHGDHLAVLDERRRYVMVRTDKGAEGWLDGRQLLSKQQMEEFRRSTENDRHLPSQGQATTFDLLNIHIDPDRRSPAFTQIGAGTTVDVLAHKAVPKATGQDAPSAPTFVRTPAAAQQAKQQQHRSRRQKTFSLRPPMPAPPEPPANWLDLSSERINGPTRADERKAQVQQELAKRKAEAAVVKPVVLEDWALVRTKDNRIGWVLARNLYMAIPDEVAQYAEGQRISSYFDLGAVEDDERGTKHNWLWTTSSKPQSIDFDRLRVFYWNRRKHRYETSYRQKDLNGYFPVEVEPAPAGVPERRFSIIIQDDKGSYWKKRYSFDGTLVHLSGTEPYEPAAGNGPTKSAPLQINKAQAKRPRPGWFARQRDRLRRLFHFGR